MYIAQDHVEPLIDVLTVTLEPEDYWDQYQNTLRQYTRTMSLPGFRPGKVPPGLIRQKYGTSILAEQLNQMVGKTVGDYLQQEQVAYMGRPYLLEDSFAGLSADEPKTYAFRFELGLEPQFELNLEALGSFTQFEVAVNDADLDQVIQRYRYQHGTRTDLEQAPVEPYTDGTALVAVGILKAGEPQTGPGPLTHELMRVLTLNAALIPACWPLLSGRKPGDDVEFIPREYFTDPADGAAQFRVPLDFYQKLEARPTRYEIRQLFQVVPHELNAEFFTHLLPQADVTQPLEILREALRQKLHNDTHQLSQAYLSQQIREDLLRLHTFDLPDRILVRWLGEQYEDFRTEEGLRTKYPQYRAELRYHLIKQRLAERYPGLVPGEDDLRTDLRQRLAGMGAGAPDDVHEHPHEHDHEHPHSHDRDHGHSHEHGHEHPHSHEEEHAHEHEHGNGLPPALDSLVDVLLRNEQFARQELRELESRRFLQVMTQEVVQTAQKPAGYLEFERAVAANLR